MFESRITRYLEQFGATHPLPLEVALWNGTRVALGDQPVVSIALREPAAARDLLRPSIATLGEAYVEGRLDVRGPIKEVIRIAQALAGEQIVPGRSARLGSWLARHTRSTDRRAISYHYDASNEFYALWLDPAMVYSCAYFRSGTEDLASAQTQKLEHICRKLALEPGQNMLDIGCGWGALAIHAARHHGVRVTGITLSEKQHQLATKRVAEQGLSDQVEIRLQDYRDVPGEAVFDRISSVGMFEHVGLRKLGNYFAIINRLLKPGGVAMNHGITSQDPDSASVGLGAGEFIGRYVFPDGELPHVSLAIRELSAAGLELVDAESLRHHYAKTLELWSQAFEQRLDEITAMVGERRARIWRVYLAGCAHAFAHSWINIYQLLAVRPLVDAKGTHNPLPLTRDHVYR